MSPLPHRGPASDDERDEPTPGSTSDGGAWRIFAFAGGLTLVGYLALYSADAYLRQRHGPWEIEFSVDAHGTPGVMLGQPSLGISNVLIQFSGETLTNPLAAQPARLYMSRPETAQAPPFGKVAFHDFTYLPGTVVLHCFGHEVQMLPKGLYLNRAAYPWQSGTSHVLFPSNKLASLEPTSPPRRPLMIPAMGPPSRVSATETNSPEVNASGLVGQ